MAGVCHRDSGTSRHLHHCCHYGSTVVLPDDTSSATLERLHGDYRCFGTNLCRFGDGDTGRFSTNRSTHCDGVRPSATNRVRSRPIHMSSYFDDSDISINEIDYSNKNVVNKSDCYSKNFRAMSTNVQNQNVLMTRCRHGHHNGIMDKHRTLYNISRTPTRSTSSKPLFNVCGLPSPRLLMTFVLLLLAPLLSTATASSSNFGKYALNIFLIKYQVKSFIAKGKCHLRFFSIFFIKFVFIFWMEYFYSLIF